MCTGSHQFQFARGIIIGREHRYARRNCEDALHMEARGDVVVGVVADGCGSGRHTEVGALLTSIIAVDEIASRACRARMALQPFSFDPDSIQASIVQRWDGALVSLDPGVAYQREAFVNDYLLATLLGFVMTPETTTFFGIGDGLLIVNGEEVFIEKPEGNAPPYLAYALTQSSCKPVFTIHRELPTAELDHFLLGTDGLSDLRASEEKPIPNGKGTVGPISQFWTESRYFKNPDMVRRRLVAVNGGLQAASTEGLLSDDVAMICGRRLPVPEGVS